MKFTFLTNCISPHQLPLARRLVEVLGVENYRYVYTEELTDERRRMGWGDEMDVSWLERRDLNPRRLFDCDILMSALRAQDIFEQRAAEGKLTIYSSERWFKPPLGFLRVLVLSYFKMAWRFVQLLMNAPQFSYYPMGIHAARDMARLVGFLRGDLRCLFCAPKVAFESRPGGAIVPLKVAIKEGVLTKKEIAFGKKYGFVQIPEAYWGEVKPQGVYAKMRLWGYFVEPSTKVSAGNSGKGVNCEMREKGCKCRLEPQNAQNVQKNFDEGASSLKDVGVRGHALPIKHSPRVLWVGRMLNLKRVGDLVRACRPNKDLKRVGISLSLYGHGPEEERLKTLAKDALNITFHDFVPVTQVRDLMRVHDVYVLPSDEGEGWGAVVSEALEEGMNVIATTGAGASATILPPTHLYKPRDVKQLQTLLLNLPPKVTIGKWTAEYAAKVLAGQDC